MLRANGDPLTPRRAFTRALLCATFWPSLIWIFVSKRNAALHDIAVHTKVVYSWRHEKAAVVRVVSS